MKVWTLLKCPRLNDNILFQFPVIIHPYTKLNIDLFSHFKELKYDPWWYDPWRTLYERTYSLANPETVTFFSYSFIYVIYVSRYWELWHHLRKSIIKSFFQVLVVCLEFQYRKKCAEYKKSVIVLMGMNLYMMQDIFSHG